MSFSSITAVASAVTAAQKYLDTVVEHDPDDGPHVVPGELRRTLARLRLLHGVPFSYLVPDASLLPIESIRFFYLDRAWTDALVQGVLSIGTISTLDRAQLEAVYARVRDEVDEAERTIRTPTGEERLQGEGGTITGFLLRSRLVSGWPNLHVRAYARDVLADDALSTVAESDPSRMKVLRMERLAPAVLLVLFDGLPAVVHIEEPRQSIQFGVRLEGPANQKRAQVPLRDNATGATSTNFVDVPFRSGAPGVLHMGELRKRLTAAPNNAGALDPNEFALQMLRFPYRQVFGDPDDRENTQFYDLDKFTVTIALSEWQGTIQAHLAGVKP